MTGARRRGMADLLAAQSRIEAASQDTARATPSPIAAVSAAALPDPYTATGADQLTGREQTDLTTCEAALDNLRIAFWAAGKALQVIRDARLYRNTHATFEEYLADRWDMSRPQAYRLIDAWPLAERLSPIGDKINESQVRELLPLAARHGADAAETVFRAVAETNGAHVTAAVLHGAVSILPEDHFDPGEAVRQIRAYLAGEIPGPATRPTLNPADAFTAEAARLLRGLHRVADRDRLKAAAHENPDAVRQVIADMRALLDEIEQGAL